MTENLKKQHPSRLRRTKFAKLAATTRHTIKIRYTITAGNLCRKIYGESVLQRGSKMAQLGSRDTRKPDTPPETCQIYTFDTLPYGLFKSRIFSAERMSFDVEKSGHCSLRVYSWGKIRRIGENSGKLYPGKGRVSDLGARVGIIECWYTCDFYIVKK